MTGLKRTKPIRRTALRSGGGFMRAQRQDRGAMRSHVRSMTVDGVKFDSLLEAACWQQLVLLERAGQLRGLKMKQRHQMYVGTGQSYCSCQLPAGELSDSHTATRLRAVIPDFEYEVPASDMHGTWRAVTADAKGWQDANSAQWVAYQLFRILHRRPIVLMKAEKQVAAVFSTAGDGPAVALCNTSPTLLAQVRDILRGCAGNANESPAELIAQALELMEVVP